MKRGRNLVIAASFAATIAALFTAERLLVREATAQPTVQAPQFAVDPFWPKPLPNGWVLGMAIGVAVD
jgi:hypothetical protein